MLRRLLLILIAALMPAASYDSELKDMTWLGFEMYDDASRVFVRTTELVRYHVATPQKNVVELVLENTRITRINNMRYLNPQYFDNAVVWIEPSVVEGPSQSVHITIKLRAATPFKVSQNDTMLALDFAR